MNYFKKLFLFSSIMITTSMSPLALTGWMPDNISNDSGLKAGAFNYCFSPFIPGFEKPGFSEQLQNKRTTFINADAILPVMAAPQYIMTFDRNGLSKKYKIDSWSFPMSKDSSGNCTLTDDALSEVKIYEQKNKSKCVFFAKSYDDPYQIRSTRYECYAIYTKTHST